MSLGPIEVLVIGFPGNQFNGEIIPAAPTAADDPLAKLERLAALHTSGALDDQELAAAKAALLT
jgi:hypothetical protein